MEFRIIKLSFFSLLLCSRIVSSFQIEQGLPEMLQEQLPDIVNTYQVEEKQSFFIQISPESSIVGKLPQGCHVHDPQITINTLLQIDHGSLQRKIMLYRPNPQTIYMLNDTHLVAHSLNRHHKQKDKQIYLFPSNCSKDMIFEHGKNKIFVFSCDGIYSASLSDANFTMDKVEQNREMTDIRSARSFQDLVFVIYYTKGVKIYAIDITLDIVQLGQVELSKEVEWEIVQTYYSNKQLILLDKINGLIFFVRKGNSFSLMGNLTFKLEEEVEYTSVQVWKNSIFVSIDGERQSFVAELQRIDEKIYLVRYYKGYHQIIKIQIVNDSLIIHSNSKIDVFPINRDPRTIQQTFNGYSYSHDESVLSFQYLENNKFLLVRPRSVSLTQWQYVGKKIQCQFERTDTYAIMSEQPCASKTEEKFYETCSQLLISTVTVYHKDTYIWLLLIFLGVFLAVIILLIFWRQGKVERILHIMEQIKGFKMKNEEIQFKEARFENEDGSNQTHSPHQDIEIKEQKYQQNQELSPYEEYMQSERNNLN